MTTQLPSVSFGALNQGMQVGQNSGLISAEFNLPPERPETPPQPFATIPFSRDPDFIDRGDILDQINQRCSEPGARVALVGLGGLGKSQLAIEYAYRLAERPDIWVFWVHAGTQARVEEGFRAIADAVKLPGRNQPKADIPQLVYDWLSNERIGRWLIVLDSADDRDVFYGPTGDDAGNGRPFATYLPQSRNGSILITSRNNDMAFRLTGRRQTIIEVGPMVQTDALTLLERKLGSLSDPDVAADLIQALDLVPLAISQAAAYIQARVPRSSPRKYLTEFRESEHEKSRLPQYDGGDLRRDGGASNAIFTTWQISFDHIRSRWTSAADLLSLMSFFDRQGIPRWVLKPSRTVKDAMWAGHQVEAGGGKTGDGSSATDSDRNDHAGDDLNSAFEDHMAMLRDYYLIVADKVGEEFRMHELVQLSIRRWLEASGQQETFKKQYIKRMAASFPTGQYENWATCRSLFAHVQAALGYQPSEDMAEKWATLLHNGGWYAWSQGRYEIAKQMLGRSRKVREKMLGKEDVATLNSISMFAMVLSDQGRWEDAEKLEVQVMETRKTKLGDDHLDTLTSMANLASTYRNQGRWEEAEKLEVQVMESRKTKLGADHPNTLTSMANLASTFWNRGRWNEAESLFMQVMEMSLKVLGLEHPDMLLSMANLTSTYRNQGRWKEAESLEVQVIQMRKRVLGPEHPDTLTSMANLASTYRNQGRWKEAESLDVQVMETRKTKLGDHHPDTLTSMANLASTFWNQGRWEEAEKLQVEVMETSKIKLGADHPDTLTSMGNLALTFSNQGRWNEVESLEIQVVDMRKRVLGPEHPDTLTSMGNLASTYQNEGRWEEAEMLEVEVMEARMKVLGSEHPSTLTSMANLASTYGDQGRWNTAELLHVQVMETMKRVLGSTHPDTLTSMANLASTYRNQGRWKEAESLDIRVMETRNTKLGPDHPSTLISMGNLASTYRYQDRWEEAEKLEVYVMEISKIKLGADHPNTLTSMANLASTYKNQGRWEEAENLEVQVMESRKTKLGADHPSTLISMGNLASTFWNQGRWEEAEKL
ncbi:kinesin light chain 3 [Rhypophila decipiens]|uniref:Kinesin light chain 3 n=1 Tax=Rhypophila decipiens TaxID=261697 RepID=A0AAN6XWF5_9PEZI|nr:kinesin light chain 3 [Rhypophila decipiens]